MDCIDTLILGIVQGLTEYLPVSSSGHLEISKAVLGSDLEGGASLQLSLILHVATVLSTIVILWREFWPLVKSFFGFKRDDNFYYVCKILVSCIPVGIVGFCFNDDIEALFEGNLLIVGICLLATALLLSFAYFTRTREALRNPGAPQGRDISWWDALIIGCGQAVAVLPGLSRSGTTIATGIILGDNREKVAKFSFFMVIIPILGEGLLDIKDMLFPAIEAVGSEAAAVSPIAMIVGFLASFLVGCLACKWMLSIVKKGKLVWFAVYCLLVGAFCIYWSLTH
ncbi:MAG: undecaprenyl-diphosphate phosphatase [Bacteroidales bacterium]|nr:undecaprenyl-diphosphate phosphatase [Bacteroidales bacterium]